jgi:hypothetical protein
MRRVIAILFLNMVVLVAAMPIALVFGKLRPSPSTLRLNFSTCGNPCWDGIELDRTQLTDIPTLLAHQYTIDAGHTDTYHAAWIGGPGWLQAGIATAWNAQHRIEMLELQPTGVTLADTIELFGQPTKYSVHRCPRIASPEIITILFFAPSVYVVHRKWYPTLTVRNPIANDLEANVDSIILSSSPIWGFEAGSHIAKPWPGFQPLNIQFDSCIFE